MRFTKTLKTSHPFNSFLYFFFLFLVLWKIHIEFPLLVLAIKNCWRRHMAAVTVWLHHSRTVNTALQTATHLCLSWQSACRNLPNKQNNSRPHCCDRPQVIISSSFGYYFLSNGQQKTQLQKVSFLRM